MPQAWCEMEDVSIRGRVLPDNFKVIMMAFCIVALLHCEEKGDSFRPTFRCSLPRLPLHPPSTQHGNDDFQFVDVHLASRIVGHTCGTWQDTTFFHRTVSYSICVMPPAVGQVIILGYDSPTTNVCSLLYTFSHTPIPFTSYD